MDKNNNRDSVKKEDYKKLLDNSLINDILGDNPNGDIVIRSYYMFKFREVGERSKKDIFVKKFIIGEDGNVENLELTKDKSKALMFEYSGLLEMDSVLNDLFIVASNTNQNCAKKGVLSLVGGDIIGNIKDIHNLKYRQNAIKWIDFIDKNILSGMVKKSYDSDGDEQEHVVDLVKFLNHLRLSDKSVVDIVASNWKNFNDVKQAEIAVKIAGNYNASRFMIFMDVYTENM